MSTEAPPATPAIQSRIVGSADVDPATLTANPRNWRTHPPEQLAALAAVLQRVGWVQRVIVNQRTGHLVDGHLRVALAAERREPTIPVEYVDLTPEEEAMVLVSLDPLSSMAGTDQDMLAGLMDGLALENAALERHLVSFLAAGRKGVTNPDHVPPVPDEPWVQRGEVWQLGGHRIMCGDSTDGAQVARLMAGERAVLMATDPPYLVDYTGGNHPQSHVNRPDVKDKGWDAYTDPATGVAFYRDFLLVALQHLVPDAPIYQWHADLRRQLVIEAWEQAGLLLHQVIVWVKERGVLTRSHFMWQHEPCAYGWVKGKQPKRRPPPAERSVWNVSQAGEQDGIHPTQKPVELIRRPIEWHTDAGDLLYEPFSGSGTAIIAAEMMSRRCYAMELSPAFVQVAIERWQAFTGREAVRVEG